MNIAIIGASAFDSLEYHMADSFKHLGHPTRIFDYNHVIPIRKYQKYELLMRRLSDPICRIASKKIAHKIMDYNPDFIITTYRDFHPLGIKLLKNKFKGIPIAHLNPDQLTTLEHLQIFASPYDFYFTKDKYMAGFMKNMMGLNTYYFPECFNQRVCKSEFLDKREAENKVNIDVLIYGTFYPYRNRIIENLVKNGIKPSLCGHIDHYFPKELEKYFSFPIFGTQRSNYIQGSKIVFNNFHYAEVNSVNEKFFVINGTGGFQLCDYRSEISEYSNIDSNFFTFKNIDEAVDKIKFFLERRDLRIDTAIKQQNYFLANHTYDIRMQQLLNIVFNGSKYWNEKY